MAVAALGITAAQMAAAATAVSVAATIQQTMQAQANANAQEEAQRARNAAIVEQTIANYDELADVELDKHQQALEETKGVQENYIQEKGKVNVMAAAMGTGGMSVKSQLNDLERQKYSNYNTVLLNRQANLDNIRSQAETMRYQAANSMDVSPISRPSYAAAALNIGSQVMSGMSQYGQLNGQQGQLKSVSSGG